MQHPSTVPTTVPSVLESAAAAWPDAPALRFTRNGSWETLNWRGYRDRVHEVARGFLELGLEPGKGVSILASNSAEWFIADLAAIVAGGIPTGHYVTNSPDQIRYIAEHSEAQILVLDSEEQLRKVEAIRGSLPALKAVVITRDEARGNRVISWTELVDRGRRSQRQSELESRMAAQQPEDVATLIYTSGTTGPPKGVMLTHRNLVWTAAEIGQVLGMKVDDRLLSYLPLSHIAEQILTLHSPIQSGACTSFVDRLEMLGEALQSTRPTLFLGVPRVWEKIQARIQEAGASASGLQKRIAAWARRIGLEGGAREQRGERRPRGWWMAERIVFRKVRRKLGLDQARMCFTSAAPISRQTLEFFLSLGIPILEVYGMSECTGPTTFSLPSRYRTGSVGTASARTEVGLAEDGEVLIRGPHVFKGYSRDSESTRRTLDADGWIHSGDLGEFDSDGFLTITGRKKDLIITSGGHNIAPQNIEQSLKGIPSVAHAVVLGDRRSYLIALLTLDREKLPRVAAEIGSSATDPESAANCRFFTRYIEREMQRLAERFARAETPKKFAILPSDFSIDGGELTPTMKVRRNVVQEKYARVIEELYGESGAGPSS